MRVLFSLLILCICLSPLSVLAQAKHLKNKLRLKKQWDKVEAVIESMPVYTEKLEGDYQALGLVQGQDMMTKKKTAAVKQMRTEAYKMGADAIMEFECETHVKSLFTNCAGVAIKYVPNSSSSNPSENK